MVKKGKKYDVIFASMYYDFNLMTGANKRFNESLKSTIELGYIPLILISKQATIQKEFEKYCRRIKYKNTLIGRIKCLIIINFIHIKQNITLITDFFPPIYILRSKTYYLIHDVRVDTQYNRSNYAKFRLLFQKTFTKFSKYIITVSEFSKNEIVRYYNVPDKNIFVVHNGLSRDFINLKHESTRDIDFLYVANFEARKNHIYLLKLLELSNKNFTIYLIGKDVSKINIQDYNISSHHIILKENISENDLINIYLRTKTYISPTLYEGFNMPILEAISSGCNVICSKIQIHKELFSRYSNITFLEGNLEKDLSILQNINYNYIKEDLNEFNWKNIIAKFYESINLRS